MKKIIEAIKDADEVEIDATWAILKYQKIGILRKLKVLALIFDLDEEEVIAEASKDTEGRIFDHVTRHEIHDELIKISQKQYEN